MAVDETTILVRRAKAGDMQSLSALVEKLTPLLRAQACYRLASHVDIEPDDVVQDVWTRALPKLPELSEREERHTPVLLKFLATTLLYRVQELLRERIRKRLDDEPCPELPAETIGALSRVIRSERDDKLWMILDTLAPADRELLVLRGVERQDNKAIAEKLGETPNAVSLRYNRLLARLRARLKGSVLDEL